MSEGIGPGESDADRIRRLENEVERQRGNWSCLFWVVGALALLFGGCCCLGMMPRERHRIRVGAVSGPQATWPTTSPGPSVAFGREVARAEVPTCR